MRYICGLMSDRLKAHLALFTANLIYGANYSLAKEVMPKFIGAFGIILLRVGGAVLLFAAMWVFKMERIARRDWLMFALCGLTGVACNQLLFFKGLSLTSPIQAAVILTANPLLVLIAARFIRSERIHAIRIWGILIGMAGALWLILSQASLDISGHAMLGNALILLNAAFYAVYLVLVKSLMQKYRLSTVMFFVFLLGLIPVIPVSYSEFAQVDWNQLPGYAIGILTFIVIGTTFLAYLLNAYGLVSLSPATVSAYIYLQPVLAACIAVALGKDSINAEMLASSFLVFLGVWLAGKKHTIEFTKHKK